MEAVESNLKVFDLLLRHFEKLAVGNFEPWSV
jgi:hypothetical protein